MKIKGFGLPPVDYTATGMPQADGPVIKFLTGDPENGKFGRAFEYFEGIG